MEKNEMDRKCNMCKQLSRFVPTTDPKGYWVCSNCGHRTDFGKTMGKLTVTKNGYRFKK